MKNFALLLLIMLNLRDAAALPFTWAAARVPEVYSSDPATATLIILSPESAGYALLTLEGRHFYKPSGTFLVKRELRGNLERWIAIHQQSEPIIAMSTSRSEDAQIEVLSESGQSFLPLKYSKAASQGVQTESIILSYLSRRHNTETSTKQKLIESTQVETQKLVDGVNQKCNSSFKFVIDSKSISLADAQLYDLAKICGFALIGISRICDLSEGKLAIQKSLKMVECGLAPTARIHFDGGSLQFVAQTDLGEQDVAVSEFLLNSDLGS